MYVFKTAPFDYQREEFAKTRDITAWGLFFEQGLGKTKVAIDTAAYLHEKGEINGLLVIAPNGVHANWVLTEIPEHMPEYISTFCHVYHCGKETKKSSAERAQLLEFKGLAVLCITYDAIITTQGEALCNKFLKTKNTLLVFDESARVKTPRVKRTIKCLALGKKARYRRILTGTPVDNSPFDVYSQVRILDPGFWKQHELSPFSVFKRAFGNWQPMQIGTGQRFEILRKSNPYRNLEQLKELLQTISTRKLKVDCLDLPTKLYTKVRFEMSPRQTELYQQLGSEYITELSSGLEISAPLAIVRLMRLQQIACGYVTPDGADKPIDIGKDNGRLDLLSEVLEDRDSAIIWARFQKDIDLISKRLGKECVVIDGRTPSAGRGELIRQFQDKEVRFFVGNPAAAGEGITLHRTATVVYYSNSFKLGHRLQSEDRAHRIGQKRNVEYIDLVASGTVDEQIVSALRNKLDIAATVTGDNLREWI